MSLFVGHYFPVEMSIHIQKFAYFKKAVNTYHQTTTTRNAVPHFIVYVHNVLCKRKKGDVKKYKLIYKHLPLDSSKRKKSYRNETNAV